MTIETRYAVRRYSDIAIVCESHDDAIALAKAFYVTSDNDFEQDVIEMPYLAACDDDDEDDEDTLHVVLLHAHEADEGGEADD